MTAAPAPLVTKSLRLLRMVALDRERSTLPMIAARAGIPISTAHRLVATLVTEGYLTRVARGRYIAGPVACMLTDADGTRRLLTVLGRPAIEKLAREAGQTAHLGVFESDMVTYVLKSAERGPPLFTREGTALEAYCSAIGKVLVAHLPDREREKYLADGPFIALTAKTITQPERLRAELLAVRDRGYALDDREVLEELRCIAAPVMSAGGQAIAAVSLAIVDSNLSTERVIDYVPLLQHASRSLQEALFQTAPVAPSRRVRS